MQERRVGSLGGEDSLEEEMTTHSSILAWKILWTEKPGRVQSLALQSQSQSQTCLSTYAVLFNLIIYSKSLFKMGLPISARCIHCNLSDVVT